MIKTAIRLGALILTLGAAALGVAACGGDDNDGTTAGTAGGNGELPSFSEPTRIDNPYAPLTEARRCELRGQEEGTPIRVVNTVLDRTEPFEVGGETVEVAVIEAREYEEGELVERTLDYFGQGDDGAVYYFGEDVDDYENGKVVGHEGAFRYGREADTLGVLMPADPQVGDRWRFEDVPGITVESNKLVEKLPQVKVRGTTYEDVVRVREFQEPAKEVEFKLYGRDVGLLQELPPEGKVELVRCS